MALNCCMLTPRQPPTPVPLPDEKAFISVPGIQIRLQAATSTGTLQPNSKSHSATGIVYLTSQRIVFVANNAGSLPEVAAPDANLDLGEVRSLSCNLSNFRNGKFVQPWLTANYYEGIVVPQSGGGLDSLYNLKIYFNEGRAFEFHQTLETVKAQYQPRGKSEEPLPLYMPGQQAPSSADGLSQRNIQSGRTAPATLTSSHPSPSNPAAAAETDLPPPYDSSI